MQNRLALSFRGGIGALALSALLASTASAGELSGELTVVSDYVFRGVSQTDEDPALQFGLDYAFDSGFYVGTWVSNVDFGPGDPADFEWDIYVGYGFEIGSGVAADIQLLQYRYPGANDYNYLELVGSLTFNERLTTTVAYSNDVYNSGEDGWYFGAALDLALPAEFTLTPNVGYSRFASGVLDDGRVGYADYGLTLSRDVGPVSLALAWTDTNGNGNRYFGRNADSRVFLSLGFGF